MYNQYQPIPVVYAPVCERCFQPKLISNIENRLSHLIVNKIVAWACPECATALDIISEAQEFNLSPELNQFLSDAAKVVTVVAVGAAVAKVLAPRKK